VLDARAAGAIGDREVQFFRRPDRVERHRVDRARDLGAVDECDVERPVEVTAVASERLGHHDVRAGIARHAEGRSERHSIDGPALARAAIRRIGAGRGGSEQQEPGERSREGTCDRPHIPNNVGQEEIVAIRPMRRDDVDALAGWGKHADPLFRHYDVRALGRAEGDAFWLALAGAPEIRRPFVALAGAIVIGSLVVRPAGPDLGDVGIVLDPRYVGRGFGRRILAAFSVVLRGEGFRRLRLDVARYNARAIAAYRAAGFVPVEERWDEPEPGIDVETLLRGPSAAALEPHVMRVDGRYRMRVVRMECRLDAPTKVES